MAAPVVGAIVGEVMKSGQGQGGWLNDIILTPNKIIDYRQRKRDRKEEQRRQNVAEALNREKFDLEKMVANQAFDINEDQRKKQRELLYYLGRP